MEFRTRQSQDRYDGLVAVARDVLVGLDFDGTLSPIVDDPAQAVIHPEGARVLTALAARVRAVVVVTGRPARQVVELGGLEAVADGLADGARLVVMGQYGNERWDSGSREFISPEPPAGLQAFRDELPRLLAAERADGAFVEEKGLAVAVHTRRLPDAAAAFPGSSRSWPTPPSGTGSRSSPAAWSWRSGHPACTRGSAVESALAEHRRGRRGLRRRRPRRPRGVRGGAPAARAGAADAAGLLGLGQEQEALADLADVVVPVPAG